jgi:hypothetical protein
VLINCALSQLKARDVLSGGEASTTKSSSSDIKTDGSNEKLASKGVNGDADASQPVDSWPQAGPEVLFFHMSQRIMPKVGLEHMLQAHGHVKSVVMHHADPR